MRKFFAWQDGELVELQGKPTIGYGYEFFVNIMGPGSSNNTHYIYCKSFNDLSLVLERLKPILTETNAHYVTYLKQKEG